MWSVACEVWWWAFEGLSYSAGHLIGVVSVSRYVSDVSDDLEVLCVDWTATSLLTAGALGTVCPVGASGRLVAPFVPVWVVRTDASFEHNFHKHNLPLAWVVCELLSSL